MKNTTRLWGKETLTRDTLSRLALGPFTLVAANSSPYFLHRLVKMFFKDRSTKIIRQRTKKLRELENKNLVRFQKLANDALKLDLTPLGRIWAKKLSKQEEIERIKPIEQTAGWSGKWHLLIYDLTGYSKNISGTFRKTIKGWGFYPMQRTVWVSPNDYQKELTRLCKTLDINEEKITYTTTNKIANETKIKKYFKI